MAAVSPADTPAPLEEDTPAPPPAASAEDVAQLLARIAALEKSSAARDAEPAKSKKEDSSDTTDKPFEKDDEILEDEVQLPFESIYGIACIGPAQNPPDEYRCCGSGANPFEAFLSFWIMMSQNYLLLVVNYMAQGLFLRLLVVNAHTSYGDGETCKSEYFTRLCCMCLFLSTVFGDVKETARMVEWHWLVKTESTMKEIEVKNAKTNEAELVTGLTCAHKFFNIVFIILPKLAISITVFVYGGTFIALSPTNEDAFLNTLAGYFILEIDEILYSQFASKILSRGAADVPAIKTQTSEFMGVCSLLCTNIILMLFVLACYFVINQMACVSPFELMIESSNTSCYLEQNTSWVNSNSEACVTALDNMPFCQQQLVAMSVPEPMEFPSITGCGEHCNSTMQAVLEATRMDTLSMAAMIVQIFGFCLICCMMGIALSDSDSIVVGCCTICCFIVPMLVLHGIGMGVASSVSETFTVVRDAECFDETLAQGVDRVTTIDQIISSSELFGSLCLCVVIFSSLELCCGMFMTLWMNDNEKSSKLAFLIMGCQLLNSILTWVAYGAGSQVASTSAASLLYDGVNRTTEGWCTGMTSSAAFCAANSRGKQYTLPNSVLSYHNMTAIVERGHGTLGA